MKKISMAKQGVLIFVTSLLMLVDHSDCSIFSGASMFLTNAENHKLSLRPAGIHVDLRKQNVHEISHRTKRDTVTEKPNIISMNIESTIMSRFGQTRIQSEIQNPYSENRDATFSIQIPVTAFISNFTMLIDGQLMVAEVKSKEEADKLFEEAKKQNKTAGKVSSQEVASQKLEPGMELFAVSVTIKANSTVSFELYYLETLVRKLGIFQHRTSIRPNQVVESLTVRVLLHEKEGIKVFYVMEPSLHSNSLTNKNTQIQHISDTTKEVLYQPTVLNQQTFSSDHHGISGDLVIRYDINHRHDIGSISIDNGYFVHNFSPDENQMPILPKNIIFVIDISGSMSGNKIVQTREAMLTVLGQLHKGDVFMIILFDTKLEYWPQSAVFEQANSKNINDAKNFVTEKVHARGGTDINLALKDAAIRYSEMANAKGNIVVFLTDGHPTSGMTDESTIVHNVVSAAKGKLTIFCLGFGKHLNYELLKKISLRTGGNTITIYEDTSATQQLKDFYLHINSPLLYNLKFEYSPTNVIIVENGITTTAFNNYFKGSEITIAGKLQANVPPQWKASVTADAGSQPFKMEKDINTNVVYDIPSEISVSRAYKSGFIEKLYIYMKIKDLQKEQLLTDDETKKMKIKQEATKLAIHYNLVTPYTSMIIVQHDSNNDMMERDMMAAGRGFTPNLASSANSGIVSGHVLWPLLILLFFF